MIAVYGCNKNLLLGQEATKITEIPVVSLEGTFLGNRRKSFDAITFSSIQQEKKSSDYILKQQIFSIKLHNCNLYPFENYKFYQ